MLFDCNWMVSFMEFGNHLLIHSRSDRKYLLNNDSQRLTRIVNTIRYLNEDLMGEIAMTSTSLILLKCTISIASSPPHTTV